MKARIIGPRGGLDENNDLPWMGIDIDYEELPKVGEHICLNSGSVYVVRDISWWVTAPRDEDYWSRGDYQDKPGEHEIVHITVESPGKEDHFDRQHTLDKGYANAVADMRNAIEVAKKAGLDGMAGVSMFLAFIDDSKERE